MAADGEEAATPKMTTIMSSSNVHSVGHDGADLLIRFKGAGGLAGPVYRYAGAPASLVEEIVGSDSPGGFIRQRVIGRFPHAKEDG